MVDSPKASSVPLPPKLSPAATKAIKRTADQTSLDQPTRPSARLADVSPMSDLSEGPAAPSEVITLETVFGKLCTIEAKVDRQGQVLTENVDVVKEEVKQLEHRVASVENQVTQIQHSDSSFLVQKVWDLRCEAIRAAKQETANRVLLTNMMGNHVQRSSLVDNIIKKHAAISPISKVTIQSEGSATSMMRLIFKDGDAAKKFVKTWKTEKPKNANGLPIKTKFDFPKKIRDMLKELFKAETVVGKALYENKMTDKWYAQSSIEDGKIYIKSKAKEDGKINIKYTAAEEDRGTGMIQYNEVPELKLGPHFRD